MKPRIYDYDNYRSYLSDYYASAKASDPKFSFRYFSKRAGFKSPNFLKLVIKNESNLSEDSIDKFINALKLDRGEGFFFRNLVLLNQATSTDERQRYARELLRSKTYRSQHPLKGVELNLLSHWYFMPVRELVAMPSFKEDPHWISRRVQPSITPAEAKKALTSLLELGLLKRDERGRLQQSTSNLATPDEVSSSFAAHCHRELMKRASESIDSIPRQKRDISSVTLGVTFETMKKIKELIQEFRREIVAVASQDEVPETVYQLNLQLFPLVKEDEEVKS